MRFGEPSTSLEFSLLSNVSEIYEKVDLFWIYSNETHFHQTIHIPTESKFRYQVYPSYELCSVELEGIKVLASCKPEKMVKVGMYHVKT